MEWRLKLAITLLTLTCYNINNNGVDGFIGIYWGRFSTQSMVPSVVVDLFVQNGIRDIRLSSPSPNVLEALQGSSLGLTVALQNDFVRRDKWSNLKNINDWVAELIAVPSNRGVNITTLVVLELPFSSQAGRQPIWNFTDVFKQARDSLRDHGLSHIRTTTVHTTDMLKTVSKPSEADFTDVVHYKMKESLSLLHSTGSFFMLEIYPVYSIIENNWPVEFGFVDNKSNYTVVDGKYVYTNVYEFVFDSFVVAIEKAGFPDMEIMVGQIGWPTDGGIYANNKNAERFHRGFLQHIAQKKGTPRRPNTNINMYLGTLLDENKYRLQLGPYHRHRGIYNFDGTPKYKIDFTGRGRNMYPTTAKGIVKMPSRWCIFNGATTDVAKVNEQVKLACSIADCTSLGPDSTCSNLNYTWNVSYAFNIYYQTKNQDLEDDACNFDGLGALTPVDPSVGSCIFPVEILTAETVDGGIQIPNYIGYSRSGGDRRYTAVTFFTVGISFFFVIFALTTPLFVFL